MVRLRRIVIISLLAIFMLAGLVCFNLPSAPCSSVLAQRRAADRVNPRDPDTERAPSRSVRIAQTVARLRQVKVDGMENDVPEVAQPLLTRLKHQLRDLILARLNQPGTEVASLRSGIVGELNAAGVTVAEPPEDEPATQTERESSPVDTSKVEVVLPTSGTPILTVESASVNCSKVEAPAQQPATSGSGIPDYVYGDIEEIDVRQPEGYPDLAAAVTTLGVCCGSDSSLYLFQRSESFWHLILAQEANGYEEVSGAQGSFEYRISPPDSDGRFFVVTANVNPWCTSNWQSIRYQVMRPAGFADAPQVILKEDREIYIGVDPPIFKLEADAGSFALSFTASQGLDAGKFSRTHMVKYRIDLDRAVRIPPLAETPEDFLDEWLGLDWEEAARWVTGSQDLQSVHAALHGTEGYRAEEILSVDPCADGNTWHVELSIKADAHKQGEPPTALPDELFFTVVKRKGVFFVQSVSSEAPPDCSEGGGSGLQRSNASWQLALRLRARFPGRGRAVRSGL
jgi:hypothetical protein